MARIFDVAKYILIKMGRLSTMKLQKLCYYSQAWAMVWDDEPLFNEDFEAWANGPVCRELFNKTQGQFWVEAQDEDGDLRFLKDYQKETIDAVLKYYGKKDAQWLSQLTHAEEPWIQARKDVPLGIGCSNIITKDSMVAYYGGL